MTRQATRKERAPFEFQGGLHLRDTVLWLDAPTPRQLCFISHGDVPGALAHQKILATERTADLLRALAAVDGRGRRVHEPQALVTPFGRPFALGQLTLELFPSGNLLGAASLLIQHQGRRIVYSAEINPRRSLLVERLEARRCDLLVLGCRFGDRRFSFPPYEALAEGLVGFARQALARGRTPVFFCDPLGEAQELAYLLLQAGVPVRAHRLLYSAGRVYQRAGTGLEGLRRHSSGGKPGSSSVLWPLRLRTSPSLARLGPISTALVSGLAVDPRFRETAGCEAAFALSSRADYSGILEYVQACKPSEVLLCGGCGPHLEEDLTALGFGVSGLVPPEQMNLF